MANRTCVICGARIHPQSDALCAACYHASTRKRPEGAPRDVRSCPNCGGPRYRKAALCRACRAKEARGKNRVDNPTPGTGRRRARERYELLGPCEHPDCEAPATDRHHVDGNPTNNEPGNIARLCRRHHMEVDGRLARLAAQAGYAGKRGGWPTHRARKQGIET